MVPVALRAEASQKRRPPCVRRSRTEVTSTISQRSSPWGISGMGMLPRIQFLDLRIHAARQHQGDHFVIAHERPERVLERRRLVLLDQKMREPRTAVTRHETEKEQPPSSSRNQIDQKRDAGRGSDQMEPTRRGLAVLRQIERPKLREGFKTGIFADKR